MLHPTHRSTSYQLSTERYLPCFWVREIIPHSVICRHLDRLFGGNPTQLRHQTPVQPSDTLEFEDFLEAIPAVLVEDFISDGRDLVLQACLH